MLQNKTCSIPSDSIWIDPFLPKNYMTNFWIGNNAFQCLAESLHAVDAFKIVITKDSNNQKFKTFLQTS